MILAPPGGRDYSSTAYTGYDDSNNFNPFLFVGDIDSRLHPIERVSAIDIGSGAVAYSFTFLAENPVVNDMIGDVPVVIFFDDETESAFRSFEADGDFKVVGSSTTYRRDLEGRVLTFRLDGDGALRDNQTSSAWNRFGHALSGALEGAELTPIIHGDHFWFAWASFKPDTRLIKSVADLVTG